MMKCLLCMVMDQDETKCIQVDSKQWQQFNIKYLIDKYLWCIAPITSKDCVCSPCWKELNAFHEFYKRIENAHNYTEFKVKTEIDPLEEEDNKQNIMLLENPMEPQVLNDQSLDMSIVNVQKNEEISDAYGDGSDMYNYNKCLDIPVDDHDHDHVKEDSDGTKSGDDYNNCLDIPVDDHVKEDSDGTKSGDDVPVVHRNTKRKYSTKTKSEQNSAQAKNKLSKNDTFLKEHFQITCNECQLPFDRFSLLCQHYRKEHNAEAFVTCCEMKFFSCYLLVDHINYHLNPEYFKCLHCDKLFTMRSALLVHMKSHKDPKYACNLCDKKFRLKYMLDSHKLRHSEKKFPCNECGKFYVNEYVLTQHQRAVHLAVYAKVCDICGQTFSGSSALKRHMKKHDPTAHPVKCDDCGLLLTSEITLKNHRDLKHPVGGCREHKCHICMKISPTLRALKKHIHETHEMGYMHKCTVCGKEFKRLENMKSHMAMHTGTPLYQCPECPKEFYSSGSMTTHRKLIHPVEWEEARRKKYSGNLPPVFKPPKNKKK